jgi:putative transposase
VQGRKSHGRRPAASTGPARREGKNPHHHHNRPNNSLTPTPADVSDSLPMAHPPRIPVWLRPDQPVIWFVTICEKNRKPVWGNRSFFEAFRQAVDRLDQQDLWFVRSAVVMPDHLHLLASPLGDRDRKVGDLSGALKRWVKQGIPEEIRWDWQPGSFDRLLRKGEFAHQKWEYMRENPVRAGLVAHWEDWPWSLGIREPRSL